jgi:integrase
MAAITLKLSKRRANGKAEVIMRLTAARGEDYQARTGILAPVQYWNEKDGRLVVPRRFVTPETRSAVEAQKRIEELCTYILSAYEKNTLKTDKKWLKHAIDKYNGGGGNTTPLADLCRKRATLPTLSQNTQLLYLSLAKELDNYAAANYTLYAETLTLKDIEALEIFMLRNKCQNSVNSYLQRLCTICNWCTRNKLINANPFDGYKFKGGIYGTPTYLTIEERDRVWNYTPLTRLQTYQRDVFIFQCHIGCRASDLLTLKKDNVTPDGFLQYIQKKTRAKRPTTIRVPLDDTARTIVARYKKLKGDKLLPFRSISDYNRAIKLILKIASVDRKVLVLNKRTLTNEARPLYDIAASHLARRTFMANLYKAVKSERIVSAFTGHSEGTKVFSRYTEIDDTMKSEILQQFEADNLAKNGKSGLS